MVNEKEIMEAVDKLVCESSDFENVQISFMANDKDVRLYICSEHKEYDAIEEFISEKFDVSAFSLDFIRVEFDDEWVMCSHCYGHSCTTPSNVWWTPDYWRSEDGVLCRDCTKEFKDEYLEHLKNNPDSANTILSHNELVEAGYAKIEQDFTVGMNYGYRDNPHEVLKHLQSMEEYQDRDMIFSITSSSPFDTSFCVYY